MSEASRPSLTPGAGPMQRASVTGDFELLYVLVWLWFGTRKPMKEIAPTRLRDLWTGVWFAKGERQTVVDTQLKRFRSLLDCEWGRQGYYAWQELGLLVLYDQVPRNIFRGSPEAYIYDSSALKLAKKLLLSEEFVPLHGKVAIVICHLHSENIADHVAIEGFAAKVISHSKLDPCVAKALRRRGFKMGHPI